MGRQGFKCIQCKLLIHKKCHKLIKISCNTEQVAALTTPPQVHLLSNTLNSSGGSFTATATSTAEPPITLRQNGDGTEAPPAPLAPIFESHSESVPVDGKPGNYATNYNFSNHKLDCLEYVAEEGVEGGAVQRPYSMADFELIRVIGRGSYAKVLMVELRKTRRVYAMKVIKKELVTDDEVLGLYVTILFYNIRFN